MKTKMLAEVVRVDQTLDLNGGGLTNFVVFRFGNGVECRAQVDDSTLNGVLVWAEKVRGQNQPDPTPPPDPAPRAPEPGLSNEQLKRAELEAEMQRKIEEMRWKNEPEEPQLIEWMSLPDNVISPMMKAAMIRLGLPSKMTEASISEATTQIAEKFTEEDWRATLGSPQQPRARVPITGLQPPQPRVQFSDGSPIIPGSVPSRTVPKDDMGYPIVQGAGVDPGEVVGGSDMDEDGVGQF